MIKRMTNAVTEWNKFLGLAWCSTFELMRPGSKFLLFVVRGRATKVCLTTSTAHEHTPCKTNGRAT